jgi:hypothetical protein
MPLPVARTAPGVRPVGRLLALGVAGAIALAACSGSGSPSPSGSPSLTLAPASASPSAVASPSASPVASPSSGPAAALLLEVRSEGGFINPAATIGALPTVVVDTEGRIYQPGRASDGSNPLIAPVQVRDTGPAGAAAILAAARAAGLVDGTASGGGVVADTGSTVFTLEVDGNEVVTRVAAGGPVGPGGPGVHPGASSGASQAPGSTALDFLARLTDPTTVWGGSAAPATQYQPTAYRLWVAPSAGGGTPSTVPWPLAADPSTFGATVAANFGVAGLRSGVVDGAAAIALASALAAAPAGAMLTSGGHTFQVWVRPLLPTELAG